MTNDGSRGGAPRRRRSDAIRNRTAVIEAATSELRRGRGLQMQAVARAAGISRSTLHRHFPTRSALEEALRDEALTAARRAVEGAVLDGRPPQAVLKRLVGALAEVAAEYRLDTIEALPLGREGEALATAAIPIVDRLRHAAEIAPSPPREWVVQASGHFLEVALEAGGRDAGDPAPATETLFRALTEPLDQGLVVLDPAGALLSMNPGAALLLAPGGRIEVGARLAEPRVEVVYEDGSPCPAEAYPLSVAVRAHEPQSGVRGHRDAGGALSWIAIEALPLRRPGAESTYGVVGILSDVTAERSWEREHLRPAGRLRSEHRVPLDIARVLDEIPPHLFPEQFVSEAGRITGAPVALYVLDIDGTHMLRLAGAEEFPARLDAPLALGPELAQDGIPELKARVEDELPGATVAPLWLRGRAIGLLLALRASEEPLLELARYGAAAMELARGYSDVVDAARRRKETHAAAELQQSLLPPRIARIGGGELAGSVLPSYEVGGDWFDYVENRDGAWIAIADGVGKGATAGALSGIALAALRAARRSDQSLEAAAETMHEVVHAVGGPDFFVTAIVARWQAVYSVFSWINCDHPPPLVVRPDDTIEQLPIDSSPPLGASERERKFVRRQRRLEDGERLILHSDGITERRTGDGFFGLEGIEGAIRQASSRSATAMAKAIQEAVMSASRDPLQDDAVVVVLAPDSVGDGDSAG